MRRSRVPYGTSVLAVDMSMVDRLRVDMSKSQLQNAKDRLQTNSQPSTSKRHLGRWRFGVRLAFAVCGLRLTSLTARPEGPKHVHHLGAPSCRGPGERPEPPILVAGRIRRQRPLDRGRIGGEQRLEL